MAMEERRSRPRWGKGVLVRVRTRFDRSWTSGFEIESSQESEGHGRTLYFLRRRSDGSTLPTSFDEDELGPEG